MLCPGAVFKKRRGSAASGEWRGQPVWDGRSPPLKGGIVPYLRPPTADIADRDSRDRRDDGAMFPKMLASRHEEGTVARGFPNTAGHELGASWRPGIAFLTRPDAGQARNRRCFVLVPGGKTTDPCSSRSSCEPSRLGDTQVTRVPTLSPRRHTPPLNRIQRERWALGRSHACRFDKSRLIIGQNRPRRRQYRH
jgi:hypothetical protein